MENTITRMEWRQTISKYDFMVHPVQNLHYVYGAKEVKPCGKENKF